jgi:predicted DNA-binding transcriptional regulator AlpA
MTRLLDTPAASAHLGVATTTLESWRSLRTGPAYLKIGRSVRYRLADLEAWLDSRTVRPPRARRELQNDRRPGITEPSASTAGDAVDVQPEETNHASRTRSF